MKIAAKSVIIALVLSAGVAVAQEDATDPTVKAWEDLMKTQAGAAKTLGDMAGDKAAFDAAAAEAAKATLIQTSAEISAKFETQASDPASTAKPEIWTNWDDFVAKANALATAAAALDASSIDGVKAGMGAVGGACGDCHKTYRVSNN